MNVINILLKFIITFFFIFRAKIDIPGHPEYVLTLFSRNETAKRTTQSAKKAD